MYAIVADALVRDISGMFVVSYKVLISHIHFRFQNNNHVLKIYLIISAWCVIIRNLEFQPVPYLFHLRYWKCTSDRHL